MKVNFLIAGAQKCGTTTLDSYLRNHPWICMAKRKEVHFFDNEQLFAGTSPPYDEYHRNFSFDLRRRDNIRFGESTPIYMYWNNCPERIYQYNPKMKLILLLRNPIERAYSHWNMQRDRRLETESFLNALHLERARSRAANPVQNRAFSYVERGRYSEQIERICRYFSWDQLLLIRSDELYSSPNQVIDRVHRFLEVPTQQAPAKLHLHARDYPALMRLGEWTRLRDIFADEIRSLERITGWDCSNWMQLPAEHSR